MRRRLLSDASDARLDTRDYLRFGDMFLESRKLLILHEFVHSALRYELL